MVTASWWPRSWTEDDDDDDDDDDEDDDDKLYAKRLGAGLFTLQHVDAIIAVLCADGSLQVGLARLPMGAWFVHTLAQECGLPLALEQLRSRTIAKLYEKGSTLVRVAAVLHGMVPTAIVLCVSFGTPQPLPTTRMLRRPFPRRLFVYVEQAVNIGDYDDDDDDEEQETAAAAADKELTEEGKERAAIQALVQTVLVTAESLEGGKHATTKIDCEGGSS